MALPANIPVAVQSLAELTERELGRYNDLCTELERTIRANQQLSDQNKQATIDQAIATIYERALMRDFYALNGAQQPPIYMIIKPIIQQPEKIQNVAKRTIIQASFGMLGWQISEVNPFLGAAVGISGSIIGSDACKQKASAFYKKV